MLGEQLIKNETIALVELIKNSYDADANWVQIRLNDFDIDKDDEDKLIAKSSSSIEIEDDGEGMTFDTIEKSWMNPATPAKLKLKQDEKSRRTKNKNRIIQGEKGIGRFAIYKLGSTIEITSRSKETGNEIYVDNDLSRYDSDFLKEDDVEKEIFLDDIELEYEIRPTAKTIIEKDITIRLDKKKRKPYGTLIKISNLKGEWSKKKLDNILEEMSKLELSSKKTSGTKFIYDIKLNGSSIFQEENINKLDSYFSSAPLRVTDGHFDDDARAFKFKLNDQQLTVDLNQLTGIREYQKRFLKEKDGKQLQKNITCGPFEFEFYVFDLTTKAPPKYKLQKSDKDYIKKHRIYLYRDDIRVYPYGDPNDDWLGIDVLRGVHRAGDYLSMDQTVGFVQITQKDNPDLRDKTNREGLIEIGGVFQDFKALLQSFLGWLKKEYDKYRLSNKEKEAVEVFKKKTISNELDLIKEFISNKKYNEASNMLQVASKHYEQEKNYLVERAEQTEDLAAVGLAVETASHDIMFMMGRAKGLLDNLLKSSYYEDIDYELLGEELEKLRGQLSFIEDQLEGIQPMFRSTKRKVKSHRFKVIFDKVIKYFDSVFNKYNISLDVIEKGGPLVIECNDGVIMQVVINLLDNAVYWLANSIDDAEPKNITVEIDGHKEQVVIADNGIGVQPDDIDFIFEPFFSTKGNEGRGLGLYIAKQLLERYDYEISYIQKQDSKVLKGANFKIKF
ncbi:ATP-binding protein [Flagellimonas sp. GZD32]|uniref:sensor histidine kinase n=1 Tax=Flagellimonas cixiensis TaxID=3228750 RepID=UPI0035C94161